MKRTVNNKMAKRKRKKTNIAAAAAQRENKNSSHMLEMLNHKQGISQSFKCLASLNHTYVAKPLQLSVLCQVT